MGFLSEEGLERLVEKLSDGSNIKIVENPNGTRVGAVVDKLVEKTDAITGAVDMEIENTVGSFKVGTGLGSTDVSATVEDGFSEIDIKGNTVQNLVLEDNIEAVPSGVMSSAEATSLKLDTASGNVDMSIKGRTLQNLIDYSTASKPSDDYVSVVGNSIYFKAPPINTWMNGFIEFKVQLKPNTTYTLCIYIKEEPKGMAVGGFTGVWRWNIVSKLKVGENIVAFTTGEDVNIDGYRIQNVGSNVFKNVMLLEGDHTNTPLEELPYVEGIQGVGEEVENGYEVGVKSCGKNLFSKEVIDALCDINNWEGTGPYKFNHRAFELFKINQSKENWITVNQISVPPKSYPILRFADSVNNIYKQSILFSGGYQNITDDELVVSERKYKYIEGANSFHGSVSNWSGDGLPKLRKVLEQGIQIEESSTPTPYEPYIGDTLTYTLDEQLHRLPNGVCDEISNGKLIRRVGKVVLDGSEDETFSNYSHTDETYASFVINFFDLKQSSRGFICNQPIHIIGAMYKTNFYFKIRHDIIGSSFEANNGVVKIKEWLKTNPTTVYYELETPIITELGQPTNLDTYAGTTHITSSNTVLPTMKVDSKGKPYNTLLKPNTDYTVKWSAADGGANLDLNLGGTAKTVDKTLGSTTIKSPTTLVDNNLYVAGWGSKVKDVMVAEGSSGVEIPYVEGIVGVGEKSKNLFDGKYTIGLINSTGDDILTGGVYLGFATTINFMEVKPNALLVSSATSNNLDMRMSPRVFEYDKDKSFIKSSINATQLILQPTTKFVKVSMDTRGTGDAIYDLDDSFDMYVGYDKNFHDRYDGYRVGAKSYSCSKGLVKETFSLTNNKKIGFRKYRVESVNGRWSEMIFKTTEKYTYIPEGYTLKARVTSKFITEPENVVWIFNWTAGTNACPSNFNVGEEQTVILKPQPDVPVNNNVTGLQIRPQASNGQWVEFEMWIEEDYTSTDKLEVYLDEPLYKLPNGVCDEVTMDGKLIRRIGKVVFDGSEVWNSWDGQVSQDMIGAYGITIPNLSTADEKKYNLVSDNLPEVKRAELSSTNFNCIIRGGYYIGVALRKDTLASPDTSGLKQWLSENPTTVYYELATPVITELPQSVVRIFKDGHLSFATTVSPSSTHKVLLNKSAQIEDSVREVQSLDARVDRLESFYDDMLLETSHKLSLLDLDFDYMRESEEI